MLGQLLDGKAGARPQYPRDDGGVQRLVGLLGERAMAPRGASARPQHGQVRLHEGLSTPFDKEKSSCQNPVLSPCARWYALRMLVKRHPTGRFSLLRCTI